MQVLDVQRDAEVAARLQAAVGAAYQPPAKPPSSLSVSDVDPVRLVLFCPGSGHDPFERPWRSPFRATVPGWEARLPPPLDKVSLRGV